MAGASPNLRTQRPWPMTLPPSKRPEDWRPVRYVPQSYLLVSLADWGTSLCIRKRYSGIVSRAKEMHMILVTGANGQLGRAVVENLLLRVPADRVAVSVRDPGKAGHLAARGVEVRTADFDQPEGLDHAFAGADQVLIVSADKLGDEAALLHRAALLPLEKPVCLLYTSHMGAKVGSSVPACGPACPHRKRPGNIFVTRAPVVLCDRSGLGTSRTHPLNMRALAS